MKKIIVLVTFLAVSVFAIDTQALLKAHKEALKVYQSKDGNISKSIQLLRDAGIKYILKQKPKKMSKGKYVQLLNDYGFFLQQSANFDNNVTFILNGFPFVRDKSVKTDERYLDHKLIKDFSEKTKNLCEAVNYLDRTIELSPKRSSVYLNLADTYWQLYLYENKLPRDRKIVETYGCKTFKTGYKRGPAEISFLYYRNLIARKSYLVYKDYVKLMQDKNRVSKIPTRVKDFLQRPKRYTVMTDESPATGDATVCQDLQKVFDKFDCKDCKDTYRDEVWSKHPWLNKSIFELSTKFSRIYDESINKYFYKKQTFIENNGTGDFGFKYNNNIYTFGGGESFYFWSKRMAEEKGSGSTSVPKCGIEYINLEQKNKWENEI